MKYMIIGLGELGASMAKRLTHLGHTITALDSSQEIIEQYKDDIDTCMCIDGCNKQAMQKLPIHKMDAVIITIGNVENNIIATALVKQLGAKRIIGRRIHEIQEAVIKAIGVDHIICPQIEAAERWSLKLDQ